jgi:hypothetical protein
MIKYLDFTIDKFRYDELIGSNIRLLTWANKLFFNDYAERFYFNAEFKELGENELGGRNICLTNSKYVITAEGKCSNAIDSIREGVKSGKIAMRTDSTGDLYSLVRYQNKFLFIIKGEDNIALANYLGIELPKMDFLVSYRLSAIHTYLTIKDVKTGEYTDKIGFNPNKYLSPLGKLYIRDESTYDEVYFRGNDYTQGNGLRNTASLSIDRYVTKDQYDKIKLILDQIKGYLANPDPANKIPHLIKSHEYNILINNCNMMISNILREAEIFAKDDHPFLYHEYDRLNLNDGGVIHNLFLNLPWAVTYLNSVSLSKAVSSLASFASNKLSFLRLFDQRDATYLSDSDSNFMKALKKGDLSTANALYTKQDANIIDDLGMTPLHYIYCSKDSVREAKKSLIKKLINDTPKSNLNKLDKTGNVFPLMKAAECGEIIDMLRLIKIGADLTLQNNRGNVVHEVILNKYPGYEEKLLWLLTEAPEEVWEQKNKQFNKNIYEMLNCTNHRECKKKVFFDYDKIEYNVPQCIHEHDDFGHGCSSQNDSEWS